VPAAPPQPFPPADFMTVLEEPAARAESEGAVDGTVQGEQASEIVQAELEVAVAPSGPGFQQGTEPRRRMCWARTAIQSVARARMRRRRSTRSGTRTRLFCQFQPKLFQSRNPSSCHIRRRYSVQRAWVAGRSVSRSQGSLSSARQTATTLVVRHDSRPDTRCSVPRPADPAWLACGVGQDSHIRQEPTGRTGRWHHLAQWLDGALLLVDQRGSCTPQDVVPPLLLESHQEWSAGQTTIRHQHHLGLGGNDRQQLCDELGGHLLPTRRRAFPRRRLRQSRGYNDHARQRRDTWSRCPHSAW
jgi:hypothetical protein